MKITREVSRIAAVRRRERWLLGGVLLLVFGLGGWIGRQSQGLPLGALLERPELLLDWLAPRSELPALTLDLKFTEYERLLAQQADSVERGGVPALEENYVSAELRVGDAAAVPVSLRLLPGPDVPAGEAWPFQIKADAAVAGMGRGSLLIPETGRPAEVTGYLETLRHAGLRSPAYQWVRLTFNGQDKGTYLWEALPSTESEPFAGQVFVTFGMQDYLEARAESGALLPESGFVWARPQVGRGVGEPEPDPAACAACREAEARITAVLYGEADPEVLLDLESWGTFLAVNSLWRGTAWPDWGTLILAYDPATGKVSPVGTGRAGSAGSSLPARVFDSPRLQQAYLRALAHWSRPETLAQLRTALGAGDWDREGVWELPAANQAAMRGLIDSARTVRATAVFEGEFLEVAVVNGLPVPVVLTGLDVGESGTVAIDPAWVAMEDRARLVEDPAVVLRAGDGERPLPVRLRIPATVLGQGADPAAGTLRLTTQLWGLEGPAAAAVIEPEAGQ